MSDEIDLVLLDRYLAGECTPAEEAMLQQWVQLHPSNARTLDAFRAEWQHRAPVEDIDAAWRRVAARTIHSPTQMPDTVRRQARGMTFPSRRYTSRRVAPFALAAALLIGAVGLFVAKSMLVSRQSRQVAATVWNNVSTHRGQRASIDLTDGTKVVLGAESKLRYAVGESRDVREVYLDGEAYFDVAHAPQRPFVVHTHSSAVRVLGTKFGVRSYVTDGTVRVAVADGRVAFRATPLVVAGGSTGGAPDTSSGTAGGTILTRGDVGRLAGDGRLTVTHGVNVADYLAWVHGQLVFRETPFADAAVELSRAYNVDITTSDPVLARRRLTASIKEQPVSQLLSSLALALDARYTRTGNSITFVRRSQ